MTGDGRPSSAPDARVDVVLKLGGGMLSQAGALATVLDALGTMAGAASGGRSGAASSRLVVVPGGGPFADAVRDADRRFGLSDDAGHWMAVLAMDQYAHLLADRLTRGCVVDGPAEMLAAHAAHAIPVLAPFRWMREADPLPHSWDVTSDSIAAWVAGALGARRLVLVKPAGAAGRGDAVDAYFARALPNGTTVMLVAADDPAALRSALGERGVAG